MPSVAEVERSDSSGRSEREYGEQPFPRLIGASSPTSQSRINHDCLSAKGSMVALVGSFIGEIKPGKFALGVHS